MVTMVSNANIISSRNGIERIWMAAFGKEGGLESHIPLLFVASAIVILLVLVSLHSTNLEIRKPPHEEMKNDNTKEVPRINEEKKDSCDASTNDKPTTTMIHRTTAAEASTTKRISYCLPFYTSLFEQVPLQNRVFFFLYLFTLAPIVLLFRVMILLIVQFIIPGPMTIRKMRRTMIIGGYMLKTSCIHHHNDEENNDNIDEEQQSMPQKNKNDRATNMNKSSKNDKFYPNYEENKPLVIFSTHHETMDFGYVLDAADQIFDVEPKIMVHRKVYDNFILQMCRPLFVTSPTTTTATNHNNSDKTKGRVRFIDMFQDWAKSCHQEYQEEAQQQQSFRRRRQALVLSPSGMTTRSDYNTPMYYKYFANNDTIKILANVDSQNCFGLHIRNLKTSFFLAPLLYIIMPWTNIHVTFHVNVNLPSILNGDDDKNNDEALLKDKEKEKASLCQEQLDEFIDAFYTNHHDKKLAFGWTQKARRRLDGQINKTSQTTTTKSHAESEQLDDNKIRALEAYYAAKKQDKNKISSSDHAKPDSTITHYFVHHHDGPDKHETATTTEKPILVTESLINNPIVQNGFVLGPENIVLAKGPGTCAIDELVAAAFEIPTV